MNLQVYTLGRFQLYIHDQAVPRAAWGTHRAAQLFKLLLTYRYQALHKEQIQDWLWPNADLEASSRNLRVALSELRRVLEPDRSPYDPSRYILNGGETVCLNSDDLWVDSHQVLVAARLDPTDPTALPMLKAAALFSGEYLPDDLYADWTTVERERLRLAYERVLARLAEAYALQGEYAKSTHICRDALAVYPTAEIFVAHLLRYSIYTDETARALRAYAMLCAALDRELGVEPDATIIAMAERLRHGLAPTIDDTPSIASAQRSLAPSSTSFTASLSPGLEHQMRRSVELVNELKVGLKCLSGRREEFVDNLTRARAARMPSAK
jgi:LuxR family transcriptional regulator, maltose regulon positive regulatory protein